MSPPLTVAIIFFGLLLGSFLNVVIYRLPQTDVAGLRRRPQWGISFLAWPNSFCPHCKTPIPPWRNIPIVSYLLMRARTACCQKPISLLYPIIECTGVAIVWLAFEHGKDWLEVVLISFFLSALLVNAVIDWRRYYLLDIISLPLLWLGLLANIDARFALLPDAVLGAAGGYLSLATLSLLFSVILRKRAVGGGDYKLLAAMGAWLGWQSLPAIVFIGSAFGLILTGIRWIHRRRRPLRIPFGPGLAVAGALMLLYGDRLMIAYWQYLLR